MMNSKQVVHPKWGAGEIVRSRNGGFEVLVNFCDGINRWVRFDEIKKVEIPTTSILGTDESKKAALSCDVFSARRMIEAFRLGIVPVDQIEQFTFGRDEEVELINKWLKNRRSNIIYLAGEYGSGKSHLLSYAIGKAVSSGYAVALVDTDPKAVTFHKPKSIYRDIIKAFHYMDPISGIKKDLRDFLINTVNHKSFENHPYFKWLRMYNDDAVWEWILCDISSTRPFRWRTVDYRLREAIRYFEPLPSYSTSANVYCYLLSSIGWAVKNLLGLSGLLVIFDEAESIDAIGSKTYWERADNFVQALVRTASNDPELLKRPWETGLTFARHAWSIPFSYSERSELKLIFAFTPGYKPTNYKNYPHKWMELNKLTENALHQIFLGICSLYKIGYPEFSIDHNPIDKIYSVVNDQHTNVRRLVKASVEAFDIIRLTNNNNLFNQ